MKIIGLIFCLLLPSSVFAQALFAEANFSDQQYSALIENLSLTKSDLGDPSTGFVLYLASVRIIEVYYGELEVGNEIDIQVNVSYLGRKNTLVVMSSPYILSFCRSDSGVYFTNRDFLIIPANQGNLGEFNRLRREGTNFDGKNDCTSTNFDLQPVSID